MNKRVLILSTSPRSGSNSDTLAEEFARGVRDTGHHVEAVTLRGKAIGFCTGCLTCQKRKDGRCVQRDAADEIVQKMAQAQVIVFATPIYFYEMCGQMKTLLDRTNPLFPIDYAFRDIYLLAAAADDGEAAIDGALHGLEGWISCFEGVRLMASVLGSGANAPGSIQGNPALKQAYELGRNA